MRTAVIAVLSLAYGFWDYSQNATATARVDQWNEVLSFNIKPALAAFAIVFLGQVLVAPSRMKREGQVASDMLAAELRHEIAGLRDRLHELEPTEALTLECPEQSLELRSMSVFEGASMLPEGPQHGFAPHTLSNNSDEVIAIDRITANVRFWFSSGKGSRSGNPDTFSVTGERPMGISMDRAVQMGRRWEPTPESDNYELSGLPERVAPHSSFRLPAWWFGVSNSAKAAHALIAYEFRGGTIDLRLTVRTDHGTFQFPTGDGPFAAIQIPVTLHEGLITELKQSVESGPQPTPDT